MNHFVYILISETKDKWSYVGSCLNIKRRFNDHKYGKVKSTKGMRPLQLIYQEEYKSRKNAYTRELYLKSGIGREEKEKIIKNRSGIV